MGASKLLHRILKLINYANLCKFIQNQQKMLLLYFLADLILFVLSDRAWWGLQNFYTQFSLFMQIYSKSTKNATSLFLGRFQICLFFLIGLGGGFKTSTQNFEIINYAIYSTTKKKCYFSISWPIFIRFVLSDRAWWGLQNFYTEFINYANLCKFIQNQRKMLLLFYFLADFNSVCFI